MANYSKNVLDVLTENPARLFNDFLRFLESTQPITVTSSAPTITIPCVQPSAVESTQPITATFTCSTNVPSTSAICVTSSAPSMTLPGVQPSAELTYQYYLLYRSQHPGPTSNSKFKRWVRLGERDNNSFKWPYHPPNKGAGSRSRRGGGRRRGSGGSRGRRRNGGSLVAHGDYYIY
ncbi:uncharacterized protein LOC105848780 isoform X2 [Hydra vulgaris]|uniref:uncharacterized protein LOC105848780 isoform X2 n=1 Tax=Hydra vulgaris TaxID=6087 RepID=UPI001F5F1072|nr:uncharacterized protein LOC105848780 isoform X2 [Hydra vulgaris]